MILIFIIALLIMIVAIFLAVGIKNQSISSIIKRISPELWENETVVYMIYDVDTCCRPILRIKEFLTKKEIILFLLYPDFSDQDIENFKNIFEIPQEAFVERMNERWREVFFKLQKNNKKRYKKFLNYCMDISLGEIKIIEAF